ncbi:HEPN domain-containing protein [uncultured Thiodictyon sp.]|uniref:HEPN domain-containing protein n=1 Tax=uncultured Thiodictyon sp. TaxID=1846217 RepID=UPI00345899C2
MRPANYCVPQPGIGYPLNCFSARDAPPHETLGFLAQQACEKLIKAVLVRHGARVERTHDLERLFDQDRGR